MEKITFEQSQQLQEDIITHCDGLPQQLIDDLCNTVVDYYHKSSKESLWTQIKSSLFSKRIWYLAIACYLAMC